ncbi:MAG: hypothetical protein CM1200mP18_17730 [Gammaproteobacteria bacterium]|nr:MAG: hypothetical protein CM1200mP18_17730 [Gammaproteobacteria bacterium]
MGVLRLSSMWLILDDSQQAVLAPGSRQPAMRLQLPLVFRVQLCRLEPMDIALSGVQPVTILHRGMPLVLRQLVNQRGVRASFMGWHGACSLITETRLLIRG